jgi:hypothetical protein
MTRYDRAGRLETALMAVLGAMVWVAERVQRRRRHQPVKAPPAVTRDGRNT